MEVVSPPQKYTYLILEKGILKTYKVRNASAIDGIQTKSGFLKWSRKRLNITQLNPIVK